MGKKNQKKFAKVSKKTKRDFELLGLTSVAVTGALVISIFFASSLDSVLIRSKQYASVLAAVLVDMANQDRSENRLHGLRINPVLTKAAQLKADDMAAKSYFAHTSPEGVDPWHWFDEAGYKFSYAGENLAVDFNDSSAVNAAWMNSPAHRANLLDQHYTEIGIAVSQGFYQGRPTTFVVQEFGTPAPEKESSPPETTRIAERKKPSVPATAIATTARVLGESAETKPAAQQEQVLASPTIVQKVAASPKRTLQYAYYILASLVLIALAVAAGFEFHVRHIKKAMAASALVALMAGLFYISDRFVFPAPSVPESTMSASAVSR